MVVGSTGTGKSTLIGTLTNEDVEANAGTDSVTVGSALYRGSDGGLAFVDTQGFEDSKGCTDEDIYADLMLFLKDGGVTRVKAVVWCTEPSGRKTSTLQRQAGFIAQFGPDIWKNVVIQVKRRKELHWLHFLI